MNAWSRLGMVGALIATSVLRLDAEVLFDDFAMGGFTLLIQGERDLFYVTQPLDSPVAGGLRLSNIAPGLPSRGVIIVSSSEGTYRFQAIQVLQGVRDDLGWFGGLQRGIPPSGPGVVTTSELLPFSPSLDLSGEFAFELEYDNLGPSEVTVQISVYGSTLDEAQVDQSAVMVLPEGAGTQVLAFSSIFAKVDPASVGGVSIRLRIVGDSGGEGQVNLARFAAAGGDVFGDGFETGDTSRWSFAEPSPSGRD